MTSTKPLTDSEKAGILNEASALNFGNKTLSGSATRAEADELGKFWVGPGYRVASDGRTLISADGLRQYRPPTVKDNPFTHTGVQANFEKRPSTSVSGWPSNAHLDISD